MTFPTRTTCLPPPSPRVPSQPPSSTQRLRFDATLVAPAATDATARTCPTRSCSTRTNWTRNVKSSTRSPTCTRTCLPRSCTGVASAEFWPSLGRRTCARPRQNRDWPNRFRSGETFTAWTAASTRRRRPVEARRRPSTMRLMCRCNRTFAVTRLGRLSAVVVASEGPWPLEQEMDSITWVAQ
uniref:(northern house mosquito) hypothetical protein n=1 Tax=Culex pipiens TaxID=7175 RepID=A0A8D8E6U5_CULPI